MTGCNDLNFHPDVLAAHAQFGGDLQLMQKAYEYDDLRAEIERLTAALSEARAEALAALEAWQAWEAKLILEGSDALWCELGDLNELQAIRNDALSLLKERAP